MIFFTDRDLGPRIFPQILRDSGIQVERHVDHFPDNARDQDWIPTVAARGWYIVTRDWHIRYRPIERDAVMQSRAGMFVLIGQAPHPELARNFVNTLSRIAVFTEAHPLPFIAKVYRPSPQTLVAQGKPGRVELWFSSGS